MGSSRFGALRMHHFLAMRRLLFLVLAMLFCVSGWANVPAQSGVQFQTAVGPFGDGTTSNTMGVFSNVNAACAAHQAIYTLHRGTSSSWNPGTITSVWLNDSGTQGRCMAQLNGNNKSSDALIAAVNVCPANSTAAGSTCACKTGYIDGTGAAVGTCVVPPDPCALLAGQDAGDWVKDKGVNAAGTGPVSRSWSVCNAYITTASGACVVTVANATCDEVGFNTAAGPGTGFWRCTGRGVYTGTSAIAGKCDASSSGKGSGDTAADPSPATPPVPGTTPPKPPSPKPADGLPAPAPCPAGQAPGTANGTTTCYPTGSDTPKAGGTDSSTTNSDGSKVTQHDETTCNAGGSKCSTDTTKCTTPAGSTTATCATTNSTDTAVGTCVKSPGNSTCSGGTGGDSGAGFGGDCTAGFTVKGDDPILNAMALEQYKRNCLFFQNDANAAGTVNRILSGADVQNTDAMKAAATSAPVTVDSFDSSGRGWGRGCPSDPRIDLVFVSRSFDIPFSRVCAPLQAFAMAGVALTMLGSFVWVMGGGRK